MLRLLGVIVLVILVSTFITYGLNRVFKKIKFIKYIPALITFIIMVNNIMITRSGKREGFADLAAIIVAMMCFAASVSGLVTALYFDFIYLKMRSK